VPKEEMPVTEDGEYADLIMNSSTMYNRENPFQLDEMSLTRIMQLILRYINKNNISPDEGFEMIRKFLEVCNPVQAKELDEWVSMYDSGDKAFLLQCLIEDDHLLTTVETMKNVLTIDDLAKIYETFPFLQQSIIYVCMTDSNGNMRRVPARRRVVMGKEYILRLKQYAEEKFSATSLSSTNIRNENAKSKANREYRTLYSHTPIRAGDMEINSFNHIGPEKLIEVLLIHSVSPHARLLVEQFSTGDPYMMDIRLDHESTNRSAEIVQTYFKAIGLRLVFKKIAKKKVNPFTIHALEYDQFAKIDPFDYVDPTGLTEKQLLAKIKKRNDYINNAMKRWEKGELVDPFIVHDLPLEQ